MADRARGVDARRTAPSGRRLTRSSPPARTARCPTLSPGTWRSPPASWSTIDWGAQVDGYCSDCTRTVAAGEPTSQAREVYELVLGAEQAGVAAVRAGAGGREVDAAARAVIDAGRSR